MALQITDFHVGRGQLQQIRKQIIYIICITTISFVSLNLSAVFAQEVQLVWSPSSHPEVSHYGIYRSTHIDASFHLLSWVKHPDSTYIDKDIDPQAHYLYAVTAIDSFGNESDFSNIVNTQTELSPTDALFLHQNYPNPFNPTTTLSYKLPESSHVKLSIYNIKGQEIKKLVNEFQTAGEYTIKWNGLDKNGLKVASGIYFYKIKAGDFSMFKRMTITR